MYNRYVPQSDGSFRKKYYPDAPAPKPHPPQPVPPPPKPQPAPPQKPPEPKQEECCQHADTSNDHCPPPGKEPCRQPRETSAGSFLRQLLPTDFDTGDLLIILLLLLMAGDCSEQRNTALLTLALYFLM